MATESETAAAHRGADPLTRGLLGRLAAPVRPGRAEAEPGDRPPHGCDFLPDLPAPQLLALLSAYHRRGVQVGFPELLAERV